MLKTVIVTLGFLWVSLVNAQTYSHYGKVQQIRSHDLERWGSNADWILVEGFNNGGNCRLYGDTVLVRIKDDEHGKKQFSMVMMAYAMGKSVNVFVDDTVQDASGWCFLRYMDLK